MDGKVNVGIRSFLVLIEARISGNQIVQVSWSEGAGAERVRLVIKDKTLILWFACGCGGERLKYFFRTTTDLFSSRNMRKRKKGKEKRKGKKPFSGQMVHKHSSYLIAGL